MTGVHVTNMMPIVQCGQDRHACYQLSVVQWLIVFHVYIIIIGVNIRSSMGTHMECLEFMHTYNII